MIGSSKIPKREQPKRGLLKVPPLLSAEVHAGIAAGNIDLSSGPTEGDGSSCLRMPRLPSIRRRIRLAQFERKKQVGVVLPCPALPRPARPRPAPPGPARPGAPARCRPQRTEIPVRKTRSFGPALTN